MSDAAEYLDVQLPEILALLQGSDVRELDVREGGVHVRVHRIDLVEGEVLDDPAEGPAEHVFEARGPFRVTAPLVGTFYCAAEPGRDPLISEGSHVEETTIVGMVEALQLVTEIEAGCRGVVSRVLTFDGQPVEYGQVLFEVTSDA